VNCDDGLLCTIDDCVPQTGECTHAPDPCDDGDQCTHDSCSQQTGCAHASVQQPGAITGDLFGADKATYSWVAAAGASVYDVVRGPLSALPVGPGGGDEICLGSTVTTSSMDESNPDEGAGVFYVVRGRNACTAPGTYGFGSGGTERVTQTCP